jgi:hypothetical protein
MKGLKLLLCIALAGLFLWTALTPAFADEAKYPKYDFSLGVWQTGFDGGIGSNGTSGSLKDDLLLPDQSPMTLGFTWSLNPKNNIKLGYTNFNQSATSTLTRAFVIKGDNSAVTPYLVGNKVNTTLKINFLDVDWEHSCWKGDTAEAGFVLGIKNTSITSSINVQAGTTTVNPSEVSGSVPIPQIGLFGKAKLGEKMNGYARLAGLALKSGGTQGEMMDYRAGISYDFNKQVGCLLDYRYLKTIIKDNNSNEVWLRYAGPSLSLNYKF